MTRILNAHAEFGDKLAFSNPPSALDVDLTIQRSGLYSFRSRAGESNLVLPAALAEGYIRVAFRTSRLPQHVLRLLALSSTNNVVDAYLNDQGVLQCRVGADFIGDIGPTVQLNTWYLFECYAKIADSGGRVTFRLDGNQVFDFSGDTQRWETGFQRLQMKSLGDYLWWDDVAVNDVSGGGDNAWCGDGRFVLLAPNANGDVSQWAGSDGDGVDNYLLVDEIPPDGDTSYIESDASGERDLVNVQALGVAAVTIRRVFAEYRARSTGAGVTLKPLLKVGGTVYTGEAQSLQAAFARVCGPQFVENPASGSAWTAGDVAGVQVGVEVG